LNVQNSISVRNGTRQDLDSLLGLATEFGDWFRQFDPEAPATDVETLTRTLNNLAFCENPHLFCLIAEQDNAAVGYALYNFGFWSDSCDSVLFLSTLYSKHPGQGIGQALLNALTDIARARECGRLMLNVWDQNTSAISFYQRLGAIMISDEPIMYFQLS
jgi:ribosomal protein S18 acetylase RimI-like enzyme